MRLACKTDTDTSIRWIHDMSVDIGESSTPDQLQAHVTPQLLSDQRRSVACSQICRVQFRTVSISALATGRCATLQSTD